MATLGGRAIGVSSFPSSSSSSYFGRNVRATPSSSSSSTLSWCLQQMASKSITWHGTIVACSTIQESSSSSSSSSTSTVTTDKKEVKAAPKAAAPAKARPAKAPAKPLPQMMEEDVIPSVKAILEDEDDISEIDLSFQDNKLEGSFLKKGYPYSFWAFFPDGALTGPKGFSMSSYGSEASSIEPFLVDEKKITAKHVVFWVKKRLAAQGIIPLFKEELPPKFSDSFQMM